MRPRLLASVAVVFLLGGCAGAFKPRPPAFSLYERQRLVVLPFENLTQDPALARVVQDEVLSGLVRLNACPVADQAQVQAMLANMGGIPAGGELDPASRKKLADTLQCDIIMVGIVSAYGEDMRKEEPKRVRVSARKDEVVYRWGYSDTATVQTTTSIKLIDTLTGNIVWTRKAQGSGQFARWIDLPWPGENASPPAGGWNAIGAKAAEQSLKDGEKEQAAAKTDDGKGGQGQAPGTTATTPQGQTINIVINNTQANTQTQQTTQTVSQNQSQAQNQAPVAAPAAAAPPQLLYQSDKMIFRAREQAVGSAAGTIIRDFTGTWGWQPGAQNKAR